MLKTQDGIHAVEQQHPQEAGVALDRPERRRVPHVAEALLAVRDVPERDVRVVALVPEHPPPDDGEQEGEQQVQPQPKKARTAKGKEVARGKQPVATVVVKSRARRGEIPPQTNRDGTEARERDPEKVVSGLL